MENTYHFELRNWKDESWFSAPIPAATYAQALDIIYQDTEVTSAHLKALKLWGGRCLISPADLAFPTGYDVIL